MSKLFELAQTIDESQPLGPQLDSFNALAALGFLRAEKMYGLKLETPKGYVRTQNGTPFLYAAASAA